MRVVHQSFEGRYSDNPRALYERWIEQRPGDNHVWLADPAHRAGFPAEVDTVVPYTPECVAALEQADLLIANTHTDVDWVKRPDAVYLQTWHGTPLKRVHRDVLWAPQGRLDRLDRDVARWDLLISPNRASTPRLRSAFRYRGEILETGYPRNDVLLSSRRGEIRHRLRRELEIDDDTVAVLYAPTWRDDLVFDPAAAPITLGLDVNALAGGLGPKFTVLVRVHALQTGRHVHRPAAGVHDVSYHADVADLYLAADVLVTDYSSTMFDFAVTGKPIIFYAYDLPRFRDEVRGFYFDLEAEAPGPVVAEANQLADALRDLTAIRGAYAAQYARFQQRYCSLEDGRASDRVLERLWNR